MIVLCNGVFDLLHVGHLWHLEAAKELGDKLIVSLTMDEHVNKGPGRPVYPWSARCELLMALRCVDNVVPSMTSLDAIQRVRPDIFVKGIDYKGSPLLEPTKALCDQLGVELVILETQKLSSTEIYDRLGSSQ